MASISSTPSARNRYRQRFADAIAELRSAVRLEPELAQAHYRLAQAYQRTGQASQAAESLKQFEQLQQRATTSQGAVPTRHGADPCQPIELDRAGQHANSLIPAHGASGT